MRRAGRDDAFSEHAQASVSRAGRSDEFRTSDVVSTVNCAGGRRTKLFSSICEERRIAIAGVIGPNSWVRDESHLGYSSARAN